MAIEVFKDYAFCPWGALFTYTTGEMATELIGTENFLFAFPAFSGTSRQETKEPRLECTQPPRLWCKGAVNGVAKLNQITQIQFEKILVQWATSTPQATMIKLHEQGRFEIRNGLFSQGVYWSSSDRGHDWSAYSFPNSKVLNRWSDFYRKKHPFTV